MNHLTAFMFVAWLVLVALITTMRWSSTRNAAPRRNGPSLSPRDRAVPLVVSQIREQFGIWSQAGGVWPIKEPTLRRKIIYWRDVCLDATFYALHALRKCDELDPPERVGDWLNLKRKAIAVFLERSFSPSEHAYRLKEANWPTVYTQACALHALRFLSPHYKPGTPLYELEDAPTTERLQQIGDFLVRCQYPGGGLGERPGWEPSWADSNAGYHTAVWNLGDDSELKSRLLAGAIAFAAACWREIDGGFSDTPGEPPAASCSSAFVLMSLHYLSNGNKKVYERYTDRVLEFFSQCKVGGGFSWEPDQAPSIVHTKLVLGCVFEGLGERGDDNRLQTFVRDHVIPEDIIDYASRALARGGAGFLMDSPENVYATRAALQVLTLMKRHVPGVIIENVDWEKTRNFIFRLYDEGSHGFRGYPTESGPETSDSVLESRTSVAIST